MKRVSATTPSSARTRKTLVRKFDLFGLWTISVRVPSEAGICSCSFEETREERAEFFLVVLCALFIFLCEEFLFAFFDSDTVDFHSWSIYVAWVARWDGHQDIQTFHNLSEDGVPVIEVRCGNMRDKELTAIRAGSRVCHG